MDDHEELELEEVPIVIGIPVNAVSLKITAKIYADGEIRTVMKNYTMKDIQDNRDDFKRFIGDDWNALYVLANEGGLID